MTVIDLQAMAMALACCWVPPLKKMNRDKPPPFTCSFAGLALVASAALALQVLHICLMLFLCSRPWFTGGNGTADMVSQLPICTPVVCCSTYDFQHHTKPAWNNTTRAGPTFTFCITETTVVILCCITAYNTLQLLCAAT